MSGIIEGNQNVQSAKVLHLGFNISVSGDPDSDFQIVLDDKGQKAIQSSQNEDQGSASTDALQDANKTHKHEIEKVKSVNEEVDELTGTIPKQSEHSRNVVSSEKPKIMETEKIEKPVSKDLSIINDIKSTMEHFEKFSDHIKEIPRLKNHPIATSTPFPDKRNSRMEVGLMYQESRTRKFSHVYDYKSRKEYFKGTMKPLPPDLFLKPLPGEDFYKRGMITRCLDLEPYRHYTGVDGLSKTSDYKNCKYECEPKMIDSETCGGILKKSDTESGDKQSTSSAESIKDIKIYQSGGILIMQNFKDNFDVNDKREQISDFSAKLIENCNKLKEEITNIDDKATTGNSSDEFKNSGKVVQFDLSGCENQKSKSGNSSSNVASVRMDSSESTSDLAKSKDMSPQGTAQSQDFASLSTQENDSVLSNLPGTSPTFGGSGKKLEWDSGADVGYLNLDLSKENLSTIERIVLKGLSSDGLSEKKVVYEKKPDQSQTNHSKFVLERMPSSELAIEEIGVEARKKVENEGGKGETKDVGTVGDVDGKRDETKSKVEEKIPTEEGSKVHQQPQRSSSSRQKPVKEIAVDKVSDDVAQEPQIVELADKSINVNTLFQEEDYRAPSCSNLRCSDVRHIDSSPKFKGFKIDSSKIKKPKKKKNSSQRGNLTDPLKEKIDSIIDLARNSSRSIESKAEEKMGIPKVYRRLEGSPELELSREVDEIIIDQRFKIKQNVAVGRGDKKETTENVVDGGDKKKVPRPISGSSSSNNTVLQRNEVKDGRGKGSEKNKFTDQIIQTNEANVESIGIQAFSSQKSSIRDFGIAKKNKQKEETVKEDKEGVNVSSKNIQAFGLNSSLPKQLAHPRESKLVEPQNTKSTQFFGGPINSLPNYHSNVVTKGVESCGHVTKVLKPKKNVETEVIRLREENRKNILANDTLPKSEQSTKESKDTEDKENLITEKSSNSKRKKDSESNVHSQESGKKTKKKSEKKEATSGVDSTDFGGSDDVSSNVLTSEILKEHGGSIDRNIIQEKYFQSQMIEFEKTKMISKSTSMKRRFEYEVEPLEGKNCVTVGCQYSPKENTSDEGSKRNRDLGSRGGRRKKSVKKETSEQYDSSQNMEERFGTLKSTNQGFGTGDSLPSSTQTAHSWVPGMQDSNRDGTSGVGRARSFEYLPGHIYESSGNLREELPSETEQNVITGSSSGSSDEDVGGKGSSASDGLNESEGRQTLVLENSNETTQESERMKILDENLTQLDLVVTKLWEKDDQIQTITQSLLMTFRKETGSGDCSEIIGGTDSPKTEVIDNKDSFETPSATYEVNEPSLEMRVVEGRKASREKEISIACQTEEKSCGSDSPEIFYEERKALERRISKEKESQIKWIENEIHHLNILRGLLEKQNLSSGRKKKSPVLTLPSGDPLPSDGSALSPRSVLEEVCRRSMTPANSCAIAPLEDSTEKKLLSPDGENFDEEKNVSKYGMAVTLTGGANNLRRVVMLPVGVQVIMKDRNCVCGDEDERRISPTNRYSPIDRSHVDTQCPSLDRRNCNRSAPVRNDIACAFCQQRNCVCLNLSNKSDPSTGQSSRGKTSEKCQKPRNVNISPDPGSSCADPQVSELEKYIVPQQNERSPESRTEPNNLDSERPRRGYERRRLSSSGGSRVARTPSSNAICRCEPHSKLVSPASAKPLCQQAYQSNLFVKCEKTPEAYSSCLCSKVQVQKIPNCICHVIKIHGSKCCSSRRRRSPSKKMENQSSQTDEVVVLEKQLSLTSEGAKPDTRKELEVVYPSEEGVILESETRKSMETKLQVAPKIPFKTRDPSPSPSPSLSPSRVETIEQTNSRKSGSLESRRPSVVTTREKISSTDSRTREKRISSGEIRSKERRNSDEIRTQERRNSDEMKSKGRRRSSDEVENQERRTSDEMRSKERSSDEMRCKERRSSDEVEKLSSRKVIAGEKEEQEQEEDEMAREVCNGCKCREKEKKKSKQDDHPRHYFLKIEETEVDDLNESVEQRKSLEVITVTVPVKKAGKSKIYGSKIIQSSDSNQCSVESFNGERSRCNCCKTCLGRACKELENRKAREKQTVENVYSSESFDEGFVYSKAESREKDDISHPSYSSQEYYPEIYERLCCSDDRGKDSSYSKLDVRKSSSRDMQSDYDSHKEGRREKNEDFYGRYRDDRREEEKPCQCCGFRCHPNGSLGSRMQHLPPSRLGSSDYYNYNKKEYMTKSELLKEEKKKHKNSQPSLQEYLVINRPDFYNSAESRRQVIAERAKERARKHNNRIECLINLIHHCDGLDQFSRNGGGSKRIFTTSQMREQTMKRYKNLPEVTGKLADQKKKEEYKTNRLMADVYAKKLQMEALKGVCTCKPENL